MQKIPMTQSGLERLERDLRRYKQEERPSVIRAIAEAREHGDLSENAEYHAAKERQAFIESQITDIEDTIARADVILHQTGADAYDIHVRRSFAEYLWTWLEDAGLEYGVAVGEG